MSGQKLFLFIIMGFVCGLITLIRPTDVLCLLIPLLYNVYNKETIRKKVLFIKENLLNIGGFYYSSHPSLPFRSLYTGRGSPAVIFTIAMVIKASTGLIQRS